MSYKIKSLIYFSCFLASALTYNSMESTSQIENKGETMDMAKMNTDDFSVDKTIQIQ